MSVLKFLALGVVVPSITLLLATPAPAQCDCSAKSNMGGAATVYYGPATVGMATVQTQISNSVEFPSLGPQLGLPGPPRWAVDFGDKTIKVTFLASAGPVTYPPNSQLTFANLFPTVMVLCGGVYPQIVGMTITTTKPNGSFIPAESQLINGATIAVRLAPASGPATYYGGEVVTVAFRYGCGDSTPSPVATATSLATPRPTINPCCPPWNSQQLQSAMTYQGSSGMSSPYTLKFMPSAGVNTMITAYTNYLHAVNPAITAMNIRFRLSDAGTGATAVPGASIGPPYTFTWLWNGASPNNPIFFPASQMVVNHWYRIDTTISLNGGLQFFGRECANTYIDVNIAAQGNQRVFRVRTQDGKQQESRFNAGGRPTL